MEACVSGREVGGFEKGGLWFVGLGREDEVVGDHGVFVQDEDVGCEVVWDGEDEELGGWVLEGVWLRGGLGWGGVSLGLGFLG